jgi:hypothetical protein
LPRRIGNHFSASSAQCERADFFRSLIHVCTIDGIYSTRHESGTWVIEISASCRIGAPPFDERVQRNESPLADDAAGNASKARLGDVQRYQEWTVTDRQQLEQFTTKEIHQMSRNSSTTTAELPAALHPATLRTSLTLVVIAAFVAFAFRAAGLTFGL